MKLAGLYLLVALQCLVAVNFTVHADTVDLRFESGNRCLQKGDLVCALGYYDSLIALGISNSELYFNRSLAHARLGQLGAALYDIEQSLRLKPGDQEALRTLEKIRTRLASTHSKTSNRSVKTQQYDGRGLKEWAMSHVSPALTGDFALGFATCVCVFGTLRNLIQGRRRLWSWLMTIISTLAFLLCLTWLYMHWLSLNSQRAVVLSEGTVWLLAVPEANAKKIAKLGQGYYVDVLGRENDYAKIADPWGRQGWTLRQNLGILGQIPKP